LAREPHLWRSDQDNPTGTAARDGYRVDAGRTCAAGARAVPTGP